jgi:hypothetical protein
MEDKESKNKIGWSLKVVFFSSLTYIAAYLLAMKISPARRPFEKSSNDCYRLQICPFGKETDKLDCDCEDLCENCKFCPITCEHYPDGLYLMACGDSGEYDSDCSYFEPNRSYQDKLLFEDISIALNFSHCHLSPPVEIIEDIIAMINDRGPVRCMTTEEKCMEEINGNDSKENKT